MGGPDLGTSQGICQANADFVNRRRRLPRQLPSLLCVPFSPSFSSLPSSFTYVTMPHTPLEPIDAYALELLDAVSSGQNNRLCNGDRTTELTHDAFAEYYRQQWHLIAGHGDGQYVATQTPEHLNHVVELIRQGTTREAILLELRSTGAPEEHCLNSINLAARLLTMMKFGVVKHQAVPRRHIHWDAGPLDDFVKDYLSTPPILGCESIRLPKSFNAWSIETIGGIQVGFTDNMADHLLLVEDDSKVLIFHHASFLEYQGQRSVLNMNSTTISFSSDILLWCQFNLSTRIRRRDSADNCASILPFVDTRKLFFKIYGYNTIVAEKTHPQQGLTLVLTSWQNPSLLLVDTERTQRATGYKISNKDMSISKLIPD
jgi:hypothetical protein